MRLTDDGPVPVCMLTTSSSPTEVRLEFIDGTVILLDPSILPRNRSSALTRKLTNLPCYLLDTWVVAAETYPPASESIR
jgi:hypothetical protein